MADKSGKATANLQFAKLQRAKDAEKAASEYENLAAATRLKTERLRALRLARDAALPPPEPKAAKSKTKKKAKAGGNDGKLSDWLDGQAKEGRNG
ncbi:MAG TPA: hypothetical protein VH206_01870 [Xanthobacteraceae bacterium]|jgi:hypothetical protein|nr:hypothetical protein [Xanthobacteraceae bacterium]